jgi:hypothetical protein
VRGPRGARSARACNLNVADQTSLVWR